MAKGPYKATCFCEAVEIEVSGEPVFMGFCHCNSCRSWLGAPIHAATLWKAADVKVRKGGDLLATYNKTERSHRQHCTMCGGHVMNAHPAIDAIDVLAPTLRGFAFKPTMHIHYVEHILPMKDGLPKYRDMPKELGGSGALVDE